MTPDEVRAAFRGLIELIGNPSVASEIPLYVRESLVHGLTVVAAKDLTNEERASELIGAFRCIADVCNPGDDDVVAAGVWRLYYELIGKETGASALRLRRR